jgi:D-alanyl-D-alanine carboxypeptidase
MTSLVAREVYDIDEVLTVKREHLVEGNQVGFRVGEKVSVDNLLHSALISSSNEAAEVLAGGNGITMEEFVNRMNQRAREMQLDQTLFINPSGFDNENIYSTARDIAVLAKELLKDDYLAQIVATKEYTFTDESGRINHNLYNTNELLHQMAEVKGVKTGTTDGAGQVLVTLVEKDKAKVLIVVMGSLDRYTDTKQIIKWVFNSYDWVDVDLNNLID